MLHVYHRRFSSADTETSLRTVGDVHRVLLCEAWFCPCTNPHFLHVFLEHTDPDRSLSVMNIVSSERQSVWVPFLCVCKRSSLWWWWWWWRDDDENKTITSSTPPSGDLRWWVTNLYVVQRSLEMFGVNYLVCEILCTLEVSDIIVPCLWALSHVCRWFVVSVSKNIHFLFSTLRVFSQLHWSYRFIRWVCGWGIVGFLGEGVGGGNRVKAPYLENSLKAETGFRWTTGGGSCPCPTPCAG